jgi:hypothetical protein
MPVNVASEIVAALADNDNNLETELSSDNKIYSLEWSFDERKKLFIDIDAEAGTAQIVWKTKNRFHQFSVDLVEKELTEANLK